MCGIIGSFSFLEMGKTWEISAIKHRGPDATGIWSSNDDRVHIGHSRLSIIDTSEAGIQPMLSKDGRYVLTYNGEIYNFLELKLEMQQRGIIFESETDTEVLLNGLITYDLDFIAKLNGMFAFAFYDTVTERLVIARDRFGIKPLYYTHNDKEFSFCSEMRGINKDLNTEYRINIEAVINHLTYLWNPLAETINSNILKLAPGHYGILQNKVFCSYNYVTKPFNSARIKHISEAAIITEFREKLSEAVCRQLVSDVPVGAFLSGGLDSSSICALASQHLKKLPTYTIDTGDLTSEGFANDLPYAKAVSEHLGLDLNIISFHFEELLPVIDEVVRILEEPIADPAALNAKLICGMARRQGIKVLLSGSGGDDVLTGYRRHTAMSFAKLLPEKPLSNIALSITKNMRGSRFGKSVSRRVEKFVHLQQNFSDDIHKLFKLFEWIDKEKIIHIIDPKLLKDYTFVLSNELETFSATFASEKDRLRKFLLLEQRYFLCEHNLMYTDKMSMSEGVEVRVPFIDQEFVDYTRSLPTKFLQRGLTGKWILKRAMQPLLPKKVIYRPKTGFGAPVRGWFADESRDMVFEKLLSPEFLDTKLFHKNKLRDFLLDHYEKNSDYSYQILGLLCFDSWLRQNSNKQYLRN